MRWTRWLVRTVALGSVLMLLGVDPALAESIVADTSLTISVSPPKAVPPGHHVNISGELHSDVDFCRTDSVVTLFVNGVAVSSTTTSGKSGRYGFKLQVTQTVDVYTAFAGKVGGVHPDIIVCNGSTSATVTVEVRIKTKTKVGRPLI